MFLGAGSVMHGMDDDVDMRHYGALRKAMPVTFLTFAMGYLAIIGFPRLLRLLVQGQDHRGRARPRTGWSACCAMLGAGITGFYMTRLMLMTFFTEKRWAEGVHPHESPQGDDGPADRARRAVGRSAALLLIGDWIVDWLAPVVGTRRDESPPIPALVITRDRASLVVAVGVAVAWFLVGRQRGAARGPAGRLVRHPGRPRRPLRRRDQRRARGRGPAASSSPAWSPSTEHGRRRRRRGHRARASAASARSLPLAQTGFVRSYALSLLGGAVLVVAGPPGGEPRMNDFPWLTHPDRWSRWSARVGDGRAARPATRRALPKQVALGVSLLTLAARGGHRRSATTWTAASSSPRTHVWIKAFGAHYALGVDGLGLLLVLLTAVLSPIVIAARRWHDGDDGRWSAKAFFAWVLALEALVDRRSSRPPTCSSSTSCSRRR